MTTYTAGFDSEDFNAAGRAYEHAKEHAGKSKRFEEFLSSVRTLMEMFHAWRRGEFSLSFKEVALLISTLVYVASPLDAIPEAIVGPIGLTDDAAAVAIAIVALTEALNRFRQTRSA